jgi:hypothetical protein
MLEAAERDMDSLSNIELFNNPTHQKLRERWCAGLFGLGYTKRVAACEVAVNEGRYRGDIDMLLCVGTRTWDFQIAEVQVPGRQRGREYRDLDSDSLWVTAHHGARGPRDGPAWLSEAVRRKKAKSYSSSHALNLLLYANFTAVGLEHADVAGELKQFIGDFASIWILTTLHFCSVFAPPDLGQVPGWSSVRSAEDYYP